MKKITVFDPAMCCSTGVCGPSVDPALTRFSADIDWLKSQGVAVVRFNLAQEPGAFAENVTVKDALERNGNDALPLVLADEKIVKSGSYPSREELAQMAGLKEAGLMNPAVTELVAIGAAIACNCEACFKFHHDKARKLGVSDIDMLCAVETALKVKDSPARSIADLANKILKNMDTSGEKQTSGCSGSKCC